jgi:hypothetical protein
VGLLGMKGRVGAWAVVRGGTGLEASVWNRSILGSLAARLEAESLSRTARS